MRKIPITGIEFAIKDGVIEIDDSSYELLREHFRDQMIDKISEKPVGYRIEEIQRFLEGQSPTTIANVIESIVTDYYENTDRDMDFNDSRKNNNHRRLCIIRDMFEYL